MRYIRIVEYLIYVIHSLRSRVFHIVSIKSVVAQIIDNCFKSRKILGKVIFSHELVNGEMQDCFAEVVAVEGVGGVSYGTDGEDHGRALVGAAP